MRREIHTLSWRHSQALFKKLTCSSSSRLPNKMVFFFSLRRSREILAFSFLNLYSFSLMAWLLLQNIVSFLHEDSLDKWLEKRHIFVIREFLCLLFLILKSHFHAACSCFVFFIWQSNETFFSILDHNLFHHHFSEQNNQRKQREKPDLNSFEWLPINSFSALITTSGFCYNQYINCYLWALRDNQYYFLILMNLMLWWRQNDLQD